MVLSPLPLLPLLRLPRLFFSLFPKVSLIKGGGGRTHPRLRSGLLPPPQLGQALVPQLLQVRPLLDPRPVEPVDDGVLARRDEHAPHLARVLEGHLPDVHGPVLAEVGPRRVNDGHVVLFVAFWQSATAALSRSQREIKYPLWNWPLSAAPGPRGARRGGRPRSGPRASGGRRARWRACRRGTATRGVSCGDAAAGGEAGGLPRRPRPSRTG